MENQPLNSNPQTPTPTPSTPQPPHIDKEALFQPDVLPFAKSPMSIKIKLLIALLVVLLLAGGSYLLITYGKKDTSHEDHTNMQHETPAQMYEEIN